MIRVLYFNGLGTGKPRRPEKLAMRVFFRYLGRHGISVRHIPVDWYAKEPFSELLDHMIAAVRDELATHAEVVLCGVSAGGSLAVNVQAGLRNKKLSVVVLCGPLRIAQLSWWDRRTLERIAFRDPNRPSQCFFDSVTYCDTTAIPTLNHDEKRRIVTVQQWSDTVVPRQTMGIPGVKVFRVPGMGHTLGIGIGILYLPTIIRVLR